MARHHHEGKAPRFSTLGSNGFGTCTCLNCYQEVGLDEAFNEYFCIVERMIDRLNSTNFAEKPEFGDES